MFVEFTDKDFKNSLSRVTFLSFGNGHKTKLSRLVMNILESYVVSAGETILHNDKLHCEVDVDNCCIKFT